MREIDLLEFTLRIKSNFMHAALKKCNTGFTREDGLDSTKLLIFIGE